jgi:hypothetical protein
MTHLPLGRIICVNPQSGSSGVWIIYHILKLDLLRSLHMTFSRIIHCKVDSLGRELLTRECRALFKKACF